MEGRQLSPATAATPMAARANAADKTLGGEGHGEDSVFSAQPRGDKHFRREKCRPLILTAPLALIFGGDDGGRSGAAPRQRP